MNKTLQKQMEETVFDIDIHSREARENRDSRSGVDERTSTGLTKDSRVNYLGKGTNPLVVGGSENPSSPDTLLSRLKVRFEICPAYMACGKCFLDYSECPYFNKVKFNTRHRECERFFQEVNHRQSQVFVTRIASEYGGKNGQ